MKLFLTLGLFLSAAFDLSTTRYAIHRGALEANPIAGQGFKQQALVSFGSAALMAFIGRQLDNDHPKITRSFEATFIASRVTFGVHNINVGTNQP